MENIDSTNIDNLYRAGLAHYAEALFAARHFEYLIDQSIKAAFDDERRNGLFSALNEKMKNGKFYLHSPTAEKAQTTTKEKWGMWVTHKYELSTRTRLRTVHIGYLYWKERSCAMIAITYMTEGLGEQMEKALNDYNVVFDKNGKEIYICKELSREGGTQQDFIHALQGILDTFIQLLEDKNQQTPNWITTLV